VKPDEEQRIYLDTDALLALLPWRWSRVLAGSAKSCNWRFIVAPAVRSEFHRRWGKLRSVYGLHGVSDALVKHRMSHRLMPVPRVSADQLLLLLDLVSCSIKRLGKPGLGEAETFAYGILLGDHVLTNNERDMRVVKNAVRDVVAGVGDKPEDTMAVALVPLKEHLKTGRSTKYFSSSAAPLVLLMEIGVYPIRNAQKVARLQREAGETPPRVLREYFKRKSDPKRRRRVLQGLPGFWTRFYSEA